MDSCNEAKKIVQMINMAGGKLETIDHNRHCVVGLEKYHLKKEREKYRKLLTRTILVRQQMNRGLGLGPNDDDGCLSQISEMMSTSFKDFALWQAAMHEFHAYGSTKPCPSLISKSIASCQPSSNEMKGTKRPRQLLLESTFGGGMDRPNNNPLIMNHNKDHPGLTTSTTTTVNSAVEAHANNPRLVHNDIREVMEGYMERKRLRCEVGTLIGDPSFAASFACTPLAQTTTTATVSETALREERR
jgi:hypothetical protein